MLEECKTLIMKMAIDVANKSIANKNMKLLLELGNQLVLPNLMLMMYAVNSLIKFAQSPTCHIFDFMYM